MILVLAVVLVLFAVAQAVLDVGGAVTFLQVTQTLTDGGSLSEVLPQYDFYVRVSIARAALISVNNAITDSLLLYRCAIIWHLSPYIRAVIIFPSLLILSTLALGMWATFGTGTNIPFVLAMVTNLVLLGLTAGRIWIKARQATALLGLNARRYNTTLEIICESSLLYLVNVVVYLVANIIQSDSPVTGVAWGALAQVVNIVPMMLIVRVGMARNTSGEPDVNLRVRTSQAGHVGRFGKTNISDHDVTTPLTASRQYSEV
ncbi:hypothetical protein MSAN_00242500 [Mycena sanguinolenta]|uniref:Uncharacterized protein n=1 Tax=Mycena sanguinolenta TaxID=230812 RepID=A0A8H6ZFS3_9AGAR|nr:hypothetical protein MSAN_00242500 [Mycena sanguinolenta]